jgi:tRNA(Ile)-lysidine synthase
MPSKNKDLGSSNRNGTAKPSAIYTRWRATMRRSRLFKAGERIGVAVSGGPDSMLLLDFAVAYAREAGLQISVVHFNHHLRGPDSDTDERFVRKRAGELGLECLCSGADVAGIAHAKKRNLEATARDLRYRFFFSLVRQGKLDKVATAHTASDQAETVLLRLVRGAGTRGLGGIHPILEGGVVRPFLTLTRAEVEGEIARRGLECRVDATNRESRFARNRLRERVLPLLESEFSPRVVESLAGFADRARDDEAFLEEQARERARAWVRREGAELRIPAQRLAEFPPALARRVLLQMIAQTAYGLAKTPTSVAIRCTEIEELRRLAAEGQSGKQTILAAGAEARKEFEWLVIRPRQAAGRGTIGQRPSAKDSGIQTSGFTCVIQPPASVAIPQLGLRLSFCFAPPAGSADRATASVAPALEIGTEYDRQDAHEAKQAYTTVEGLWLDSLSLSAPLTLRSWRAGDRFHPAGHTKPAKLKDLFQQRRIPAARRAWWPLLELAGKLIWVKGFGPAGFLAAGAGRKLLIREERLG